MKLKYLICVITSGFLFAQSLSLCAQSKVGNINFVVVVPSEDDNLSSSELIRLESRLSKMVLASGIGSSGQSDFLIYPEFEVLSQEVLDGINPLTVIEAELGLFVKQMSSGKIFGMVSVPLRGMGNSDDRARSNCIKEIEPRSLKYANFLTSVKDKIIEYYNQNCETIIARAEQESAKENYANCIATLLQVPEACNECYEKAMQASLVAYVLYEEQQCQRDLVKIKAAFEQSDFSGAIAIAQELNPNTKCYDDYEKALLDYKNDICKYFLREIQASVAAGNYLRALGIMQNIPLGSDCMTDDVTAEINSNISNAEKMEYDRQRVQDKEELELKKQALANEANAVNAAKAVAMAKYENQPKEIYRTYIYGY